MAHQEQHDGGTDSRLGTAFSTFTMLGDTMIVVVVVCYCTPTLGTSSAHSTLSRLVVHLEPKKESVWSEESHPSSSERRQAAAARRRPIRRGW